jgi:methylisocitrate lyase
LRSRCRNIKPARHMELEMNPNESGDPITSAGQRFRDAVAQERPLQIVGAINAYCAMLAEQAGFAAIYLSGAGVANASYGLPDLGVTTLNDVLEDVCRITAATRTPLLVDIDTGWGGAFMIARTIREMIRAGAAGVHIEDQVQAKRCGHRPGKALVSAQEMADRIKAAVDARSDPSFVIMARTDAYSVDGLPAAIDRAGQYLQAGADMIFAEAMTSLEEYRRFCSTVKAPVLANLTEFGKTPMFGLEELREAGVAIALYPLSAFRAMSAAAANVYRTIREKGTQQDVLATMQSREELYRVLGYHQYERKLDELFSKQIPGDQP